MKIKRHHATDLRVPDAERERIEVQREIDSFLRAVNSYPDRFAREPYLSFQQHLSSIVTADLRPAQTKIRGVEDRLVLSPLSQRIRWLAPRAVISV